MELLLCSKSFGQMEREDANCLRDQWKFLRRTSKMRSLTVVKEILVIVKGRLQLLSNETLRTKTET